MMESKRVVISGLGVVTPNATNLAEFEEALRLGKSGIRFVEELKELNFACQVAGIPPNLDDKLGNYFTQEDLIGMTNGSIYMGIAAIDAYKDAGLTPPVYNSDEVNSDTGAIIGTGLGAIDFLVSTVVPKISQGKPNRLGSSSVEKAMVSSASAKLAGLLALGNNVTTNSSACTTGTEAIIYAYNQIRFGLAEKMLAGGTECASPYLWGGFDGMRVLNRTSNDNPEGASRPMSKYAAGFVPGAGSGILFLESLDSARKRETNIYAEVLGGFLNCGGHRLGGSMTAPSPTAVQANIRTSIKMADVRPEEIDYINGHLTSTFADPIEVENWSMALGLPIDRFPPINSTKSLIGHCIAAAGAIECIATLLQMNKGFVHKSLNCDELHDDIQAYEKSVVRETKNVDIDIAMKSSFGFGDVNGSIIFKKWSEDNR